MIRLLFAIIELIGWGELVTCFPRNLDKNTYRNYILIVWYLKI